MDDKSWAAVTSKHRESIYALKKVITSVKAAIPRVAEKIDGGLRVGLNQARHDITSLQTERDELLGTLGDLKGIVTEHGSVTASINNSLSKSILFERDLASINYKTESMFEAIFQTNTKLESSTTSMLRVITNVSQSCSNKLQLMEQRVMALEGARLRVETSDHGIHQDALPMMSTPRRRTQQWPEKHCLRTRSFSSGLKNSHLQKPLVY